MYVSFLSFFCWPFYSSFSLFYFFILGFLFHPFISFLQLTPPLQCQNERHFLCLLFYFLSGLYGHLRILFNRWERSSTVEGKVSDISGSKKCFFVGNLRFLLKNSHIQRNFFEVIAVTGVGLGQGKSNRWSSHKWRQLMLFLLMLFEVSVISVEDPVWTQ